MARLTDHDVRDAEHAMRMELNLVTARYTRRMAELGKAYIQEAIEDAIKEGGEIDGTTIGRAAAERSARDYFGGLAGDAPRGAIEGSATRST
jgi:hypothetical protein